MRSPIRELDYPNLLSGFSFLNEPENTAKMDRNKRLPVTPLMFFSLMLHRMDKETEQLGLRAFVWNIEQTI